MVAARNDVRASARCNCTACAWWNAVLCHYAAPPVHCVSRADVSSHHHNSLSTDFWGFSVGAGRVHPAVVSGFNEATRSVTVEWFENQETKVGIFELTQTISLIFLSRVTLPGAPLLGESCSLARSCVRSSCAVHCRVSKKRIGQLVC